VVDDTRGSMKRENDRDGGRSRRWLLRTAAPALVAAIAGCSGEGSEGTPTADRTARSSQTATRTPTTDVATSTDATTATPTDTETTTGTAASNPAALARSLLDRLDAGEYEAATELFGKTLLQKLPPSALEQFWEEQDYTVGGYTGVRSVSTKAGDGGTTVTVLAEGEYGLLTVTVSVADGQVVGLFARSESEGSYSPPSYADTAAFLEESRTIDPDSDCPLPATISVPTDRDGPVPGVVLVHGSGPQDRNSTVGPQQPFKDLAWGLASRGVAVLRYRKRTAECDLAPGDVTLDRIAVDPAVAAAAELRGEDAVDADSVAVVGHSQGGYAAPRIAQQSGSVAGIALLGAPGRHPWKIQLDQNRAVFEFDGEVDDEEQSLLDRYRRAGKNQVEGGNLPAGQTILGRPGAFWNSVSDYDQVAVAKELSIPITVLQGERDFQVSPEADYGAWKEGLSGARNASFDSYADCNHLFLPGSGPSYVGRYHTEPDNVAESVVEDLADWVAGEL
jgi:pimeloyl-ACP methyl ester carboxylesterase